MNKRYELITVEALLFVKLDTHICLIDTGSPFSYFEKGKETIDGVTYTNTFFQEIISKRMKELSLLMNKNFKVNGLIGADIITQTGISIHKKEGYVIFDKEILDTELELTIEEKMVKNQKYIFFPNLHITGMTSEGNHPILLDTGACVSVLRQNLCNHAQYAYRREYYYPSLGRELSSDFMFFYFKEKTEIRIIAAANKDIDLENQMDFIGIDGELCFHDFDFEVLSINIEAKKLSWI